MIENLNTEELKNYLKILGLKVPEKKKEFHSLLMKKASNL